MVGLFISFLYNHFFFGVLYGWDRPNKQSVYYSLQVGFQSNDGNTRDILYDTQSALLGLTNRSNLIEFTAGVHAYKVDGPDRMEPSEVTVPTPGTF